MGRAAGSADRDERIRDGAFFGAVADAGACPGDPPVALVTGAARASAAPSRFTCSRPAGAYGVRSAQDTAGAAIPRLGALAATIEGDAADEDAVREAVRLGSNGLAGSTPWWPMPVSWCGGRSGG